MTVAVYSSSASCAAAAGSFSPPTPQPVAPHGGCLVGLPDLTEEAIGCRFGERARFLKRLPCVVALMGCSLSQHQEQLLERYFQEVILLLDGDKAGRSAGAAIAARLCSRMSTRLVEIPAGSQPDQLGADQIRCLCIPGYF